MTTRPPCPDCQSIYVYKDRDLNICPECGKEWRDHELDTHDTKLFKDAYGTPLQDGDTVTVIKDLKIKGASSSVKMGTKVKNIRLVEGDHDIDCKIPGIGALQLKTKFVKKG